MRRIFFLLLLSMAVLQAGDKPSPVMVRIYAEGDKSDGESFTTTVTLTNPPKDIVVGKVPIVTERDIVSFYPFSASDGSIAAYFQMDADGTHKLTQHTLSKRDSLVVAMINGRIVSAMTADKRITDGILFIPGGILPIEVAQLQTHFPVIGKEKEFADQKKKAEFLLKEVKKGQAKQAKLDKSVEKASAKQ